MAILNSLIAWRIKKRIHQMDLFIKFPNEVQRDCLMSLLEKAKNTEWGQRYNFGEIKSYEQFKNRIPLQNYESLKEDIFRVRNGEKNIIWPSDIKWFAKSSGTTEDKSKFIPVSEESLFDCHYKGGKDMLSIYCNWMPETKVFTGKTITMGGSSQMNPNVKGAYTGDLSAILISNLPFWITRQQAPGNDIVLMDEWEEKIERMTRQVIKENITSVTGVPSWTQVLFERVLAITKVKTLKEVWPNLELYMHGAVSFEPFRSRFDEMSPGLSYLETYNASEGFFGIQYEEKVSDFLLMLDYGIFYEFIPKSDWDKDNPKTKILEEIKLGEKYAMVISTNAGLWRYQIGDTIEFTSIYPFRFRIVGRTKHFINVFGEELMIDNALKALKIACDKTGSEINEWTAAPCILKKEKCGVHEWVIEFEKEPENLGYFVELIDNALKGLNSDYEAKRYKDIILGMPKIKSVPKQTFYKWMKSKGKLGGQNKVPRLNNSRKYLEEILKIMK
tara:strand:+ start:789 stop:2294 length:1506 start_codon:yes stop_codon:yes gene_type:complete